MTEISSSRRGEWRPLPRDKSTSVMRRYLESGVDFAWPPDCGDVKGNHCNLLGRGTCIPLLWVKRISDKKASIDIYRGDTRYHFKEAFVVKTIRDSNSIKSRGKARLEVNNMRDLRHPHVAALLGTFFYLDRLSILIFPAACCDLHQYMKSISNELAELRQEKIHIAEMLSLSDGTHTPDSTSSSARNRHLMSNAAATLSREALANSTDLYDYNWPLKLPYLKKLEALRGYFVCLAQALNYIHSSDVRHKDIKPENILIDSSGSVIITDFGISRSFPKQAPHVTNDKWEWTRKYASPEMMRGKKVPRDDPSDVFSLGCVFLEMATLILGRSLNKFSEHYTTQRNETAVEDAYHCNLDRVHTWIDGLLGAHPSEHQPEQQPEHGLENAQIDSHDFVREAPCVGDADKNMRNSLNAIRQMLDETPTVRPKTRGLWEMFQLVSTELCRDCDPRHLDVWKPSEFQRKKAEEGTNIRRSMHHILEEIASGLSGNEKGKAKFGGIDSALLSAQDGVHTDRQRRSSSPHIHRRSGGLAMNTMNGSLLGMQSPPPVSKMRSSSPDTRWQHSNNRGSSTTSPRPASPNASAMLELTRSISHSPVASSQSTEVPSDHRRQSAILINTPSVSQLSSTNKRNSVSHVASSPRISRTTLKTNSGDLSERQAQKRTHVENDAVHPEEEILPPLTDIMIYDFTVPLIYIAAFVSLRGKTYRSYALPRYDQQVEIGEKPKIISKVDLGSLGWWIKMRRLKGDFPRIYVVNIPMG